MAANCGSVDVVVDAKGGKVPFCPHGPTLLFARYSAGHDSAQRFYACSACRDRKECSFYQLENAKVSSVKQEAQEAFNRSQQPPFTHQQYNDRFLQFERLPESERMFCQTCGLFLLAGEQNDHDGSTHITMKSVSKVMLLKPSYLFIPNENNKTLAQYLFSQSTTDFVLHTAKNLHFTHILCVGMPRIHEAIQTSSEFGCLKSLLLDLDHRYMQVYPPQLFCRYNMFTNYFFGGTEDEATYEKFITEETGKKVLVTVDPPFGGMVDALVNTAKAITEQWRSEKSDKKMLPFLWFFPYFMEKRILDVLPMFSMLDYKVNYDNHPLFTSGRKRRGSPVRIFTNLPPAQIVLPASEGYWFCEICQCYSAQENKHCNLCGSCTSKDGSTYVHCEKCKRCVKPSRVHCEVCNNCELSDHQCGCSEAAGCHVCGEMSHKRKNCPNKQVFYSKKHKLPESGKSRKRMKVPSTVE